MQAHARRAWSWSSPTGCAPVRAE